jgi:hypothetical protein
MHVMVWYHGGAYFSAVFGSARLHQPGYTRRISKPAPVPSLSDPQTLLGSSGAGRLVPLSYPTHVSDSYQQKLKRLRSLSRSTQQQILFPTTVDQDPGT